MGVEGLLINFSPPAQLTTPISCPIWYLLIWLLPNFPSDYLTTLNYLSLICYLLTWLLPNFPSNQLSTKDHVRNSQSFFFLASLFLFNQVACKGYFCASIVNNIIVWRLFISHGKRKVYTNCWLDIIHPKISSGQFFKTWNKRIFRVLKISEFFYHQLGYLSNSSQGYDNRWMCETDSLIMVTVSWLITEINF
jgi:hypothetical protein